MSSLIPGVTNITRVKNCYSTFWGFTFLVENREELIKKFKSEGVISMQIHPRNDKWSVFEDSKTHLPGVDFFDPREISIPCGWWVSDKEIKKMVNVIKNGW